MVFHQETTIGSKLNVPIELGEVKYDDCGEVVTVSDARCAPIKVPANGHGYVRSFKLEEKGKLFGCPRGYKVSVDGVDTGVIIGSEELKKNGRIVFKKYENGKLSTLYCPVSEFNMMMLRVFRIVRGNEYPRGPGENNRLLSKAMANFFSCITKRRVLSE